MNMNPKNKNRNQNYFAVLEDAMTMDEQLQAGANIMNYYFPVLPSICEKKIFCLINKIKCLQHNKQFCKDKVPRRKAPVENQERVKENLVLKSERACLHLKRDKKERHKQ